MRWLLLGLILAANAAADLLNAAGMRRHGEVREFNPRAVGRLVAAILRNRFVLGGIAAMAVSFFSLLALLSITDLSFAIPATAATYLVETALARLILGERIERTRWIGAAFVAAGVALLML
ncbi:MAG: EamA family transporter [Rhodospirillales bacterium]